MVEDLLPVLARFHREVVLPDVKRVVAETVDASERRLRDEMHAGFDALAQGLHRLETEMQMVKAGLHRVEERLESLERRMDRVEQRLDKAALRSELIELKTRVESLQKQVRTLESRLEE